MDARNANTCTACERRLNLWELALVCDSDKPDVAACGWHKNSHSDKTQGKQNHARDRRIRCQGKLIRDSGI